MDSPEKPKTRVIYTPPASDVVNAYSKMVCQSLGDAYASDHEFTEGLSRFVQLLVKVKAKHLNGTPGSAEVVDNAPE